MFWLGSLAIPGHSPSSNRCFARSGTRACIAERGLQPRRPVPASRAGFSPRGPCRFQPPRARRLKPALYEQSSTNSPLRIVIATTTRRSPSSRSAPT
jgi:hypothetical protein